MFICHCPIHQQLNALANTMAAYGETAGDPEKRAAMMRALGAVHGSVHPVNAAPFESVLARWGTDVVFLAKEANKDLPESAHQVIRDGVAIYLSRVLRTLLDEIAEAAERPECPSCQKKAFILVAGEGAKCLECNYTSPISRSRKKP
jgi:hypothetical protein